MKPTSTQTACAARVAAVLALTLAGAGNASPVTPPVEWRFTVRLDGKPIGTHRYVLTRAADGRLALTSDAQFDVTLFGVPLYRYRHRVSERWADGCLASIEARTEDNGRLTEVRGQAQEGRFDLAVRNEVGAAPEPAVSNGCLMSFAYWNPAFAGQQRLLNPDSGRIESVSIVPSATVPANLAPASVRGLRISGLAQPIDVWYSGDRWVGLDTIVSGGRRLSYRLH